MRNHVLNDAAGEKTMVEKRYWYMSADLLRRSTSIMAYKSPSLTLRQQVVDEGIPRLGAEAARAAISDWGRKVSDITHLVFCTTATGCLPGADFNVARLLGLPLSTKKVMLYQTGCHGAGLALRLAKDFAENNRGARVLVVCSEITALGLRGPSETDIGNLVGQALFGDAAAAVIVGADPGTGERGLFEMVSASQDVIPGMEEAVVAKLYEEGAMFQLHRDLPLLVSSNIQQLAKKALVNAGVLTGDDDGDWTKGLFWAVHPGGREILDRVESRLGLRKEKLAASREVMRQYGNTLSSSVVLVLDEIRRRSAEQGLHTAGEGLEWGLLLAFGPGITVETILLRALPN
jgi:predicted naringenin-chalcone synthase